MIQLFIGVVTEGTTDIRFLHNILEKTFLDLAYECMTEVQIDNIVFFDSKGDRFVDKMIDASRLGVEEYGVSILCIHTDQDGQDIYANKIVPFLNELANKDDTNFCKVIVPIIPVTAIEAWLMADKNLLKEKIYGQSYRDTDLDLHRDPESYAHPKDIIEQAIHTIRLTLPKKRRNQIDISDLYSEIGNSITLDRLRTLPSFIDFERNVRNAFIQLHYIV